MVPRCALGEFRYSQYNLLLDDAAGLKSACEHLRAYIEIITA